MIYFKFMILAYSFISSGVMSQILFTHICVIIFPWHRCKHWYADICRMILTYKCSYHFLNEGSAYMGSPCESHKTTTIFIQAAFTLIYSVTPAVSHAWVVNHLMRTLTTVVFSSKDIGLYNGFMPIRASHNTNKFKWYKLRSLTKTWLDWKSTFTISRITCWLHCTGSCALTYKGTFSTKLHA